MYNKFMSEKEINVKVGDRVSVQGYKGTVTEVFHNVKKAWNGREYEEVVGTESTSVRVHFDESEALAVYNQYQDKIYGGYEIINDEEV